MSKCESTVVMGPDERDQSPSYSQQPVRDARQPTTYMNGRGAPAYGYGSPNSNTTISLRRHEPPTFAWLVIIEGIHAGHIFQINGDVTVIGRDTSCDVVLDDATVTRQHAKIRVEGEKEEKAFVLFDLATENGTFVNGEEITKSTIDDDDRIIIGETKLAFKRVKV